MTGNNVIDFKSKDFEKTQDLLNMRAEMDAMINQTKEIKEQKASVLTSALSEDNDDVIQKHLDKFETYESLDNYLKGDLKNPTVKERINSFFTNDETGDVLVLENLDTIKTETEELDFKRAMLLYFKQNDEYLAKIDEEVEKLNKTTDELSKDISSAMDPLNDNILAYAEFLDQDADNIPDSEIDKRRAMKKKSFAIRSGYTFEKLIKLVEEHPSIVKNALSDFRSETRIKEIGKRYASKLKAANISFSLFNLLSNDTHDSLEYKCLPVGDYPEGLENFTVFFIIRSMSMGLTTKEDITFHASIQISLTRLMKGDLDDNVATTLKESIVNFLNLFV